MKKNDLFKYIKNNKEILNENNFNELDALVLAELSYINFDNINIENIYSLYNILEIVIKNKIKVGLIEPNELKKLPKVLLESKRFDIDMSDYINIVNEENKIQFSAITFHIDNSIIIAFRGTDDSIIGWYENIYAITKKACHSQIKALEYLSFVANKYKDKKIFITGQSKGGNLAEYSSIYCNDSIKDRIIKVFNFDGQGFLLDIDSNLLNNIDYKIYKYIPEESIIGKLLNQKAKNITVVKSKRHGIFQHNSFLWSIQNKSFIESLLSKKSLRKNNNIHKLINSLSINEKENICNDLLILLSHLNKKTLKENAYNPLTLFKIFKYMKFKNIKLYIKFILFILF